MSVRGRSGLTAAPSLPDQDSLTPQQRRLLLRPYPGISNVSDNEIRRATEEYAALLLVVVRHLACLAQAEPCRVLGLRVLSMQEASP